MSKTWYDDYMDDAERWGAEDSVFVTLTAGDEYTDFSLTGDEMRVVFEALAEHVKRIAEEDFFYGG